MWTTHITNPNSLHLTNLPGQAHRLHSCSNLIIAKLCAQVFSHLWKIELSWITPPLTMGYSLRLDNELQ